jgi:hypothetical protein
MPMDAARPDAQFGVEPPVYYRKRAWSLTDDSHQDLSGPKSFVHANVGRLRGGLGSYGNVRGMRGLGDDIDWSKILSQSLSEVPTIISAVAGKPSQAQSPYGSFATGYTPGYGIPPVRMRDRTHHPGFFRGDGSIHKKDPLNFLSPLQNTIYDGVLLPETVPLRIFSTTQTWVGAEFRMENIHHSTIALCADHTARNPSYPITLSFVTGKRTQV